MMLRNETSEILLSLQVTCFSQVINSSQRRMVLEISQTVLPVNSWENMTEIKEVYDYDGTFYLI